MVKIPKQLNKDTLLRFIDILKAGKSGNWERAEILIAQLGKSELAAFTEILEIEKAAF